MTKKQLQDKINEMSTKHCRERSELRIEILKLTDLLKDKQDTLDQITNLVRNI